MGVQYTIICRDLKQYFEPSELGANDKYPFMLDESVGRLVCFAMWQDWSGHGVTIEGEFDPNDADPPGGWENVTSKLVKAFNEMWEDENNGYYTIDYEEDSKPSDFDDITPTENNFKSGPNDLIRRTLPLPEVVSGTTSVSVQKLTRLRRLLVPSAIAPFYFIDSVNVNGVEMFAAKVSLPAEMFSEVAYAPELNLTIPCGGILRVKVSPIQQPKPKWWQCLMFWRLYQPRRSCRTISPPPFRALLIVEQ